MGIMVYSLFLGDAGFISSTVSLKGLGRLTVSQALPTLCSAVPRLVKLEPSGSLGSLTSVVKLQCGLESVP